MPPDKSEDPYHLSGPDVAIRFYQSTHHNETAEAAYRDEQPLNHGIFDLSIRKVYRAPNVAIEAVGSYPTFSPFPPMQKHYG